MGRYVGGAAHAARPESGYVRGGDGFIEPGDARASSAVPPSSGRRPGRRARSLRGAFRAVSSFCLRFSYPRATWCSLLNARRLPEERPNAVFDSSPADRASCIRRQNFRRPARPRSPLVLNPGFSRRERVAPKFSDAVLACPCGSGWPAVGLAVGSRHRLIQDGKQPLSLFVGHCVFPSHALPRSFLPQQALRAVRSRKERRLNGREPAPVARFRKGARESRQVCRAYATIGQPLPLCKPLPGPGCGVRIAGHPSGVSLSTPSPQQSIFGSPPRGLIGSDRDPDRLRQPETRERRADTATIGAGQGGGRPRNTNRGVKHPPSVTKH